MRTNYDIQTTYDSAAITAMTRMTYDLFHPQVAGRLLAISFAMLLAGGFGASTNDNPIFIVLIALGCFVLTSAEYGAKGSAKQIIAAQKGNFPVMKFSFRQDNIVVTTPDVTGVVHYDIIIRLAENRQYLFLFSSERAAYVLNKADIPQGELDNFKAFISEKTGITKYERGASIRDKLKAGIKKA